MTWMVSPPLEKRSHAAILRANRNCEVSVKFPESLKAYKAETKPWRPPALLNSPNPHSKPTVIPSPENGVLNTRTPTPAQKMGNFPVTSSLFPVPLSPRLPSTTRRFSPLGWLPLRFPVRSPIISLSHLHFSPQHLFLSPLESEGAVLISTPSLRIIEGSVGDRQSLFQSNFPSRCARHNADAQGNIAAHL